MVGPTASVPGLWGGCVGAGGGGGGGGGLLVVHFIAESPVHFVGVACRALVLPALRLRVHERCRNGITGGGTGQGSEVGQARRRQPDAARGGRAGGPRGGGGGGGGRGGGGGGAGGGGGGGGGLGRHVAACGFALPMWRRLSSLGE